MNSGNTDNFWDQYGGEMINAASSIVNAATGANKSAITHVPDTISRIYQQQSQSLYVPQPQSQFNGMPSWLLPAGIAGLAALIIFKNN